MNRNESYKLAKPELLTHIVATLQVCSLFVNRNEAVFSVLFSDGFIFLKRAANIFLE